MSELEILVMEIEMMQFQIEELQDELADMKLRKAELEREAASVDNPFWEPVPGDKHNAFYNKQVNAIKAELLKGNRAEQFMANSLDVFNAKFVVTLAEEMDDVSQADMEFYVREQTEQFAGAIIGTLGKLGYLTDEINLAGGGEEEGYLIIWGANAGPINSRKRFESYWADPNRLDAMRRAAQRNMYYKDFYYKMAKMRGGSYLEDFMAKNPAYVPA